MTDRLAALLMLYCKDVAWRTALGLGALGRDLDTALDGCFRGCHDMMTYRLMTEGDEFRSQMLAVFEARYGDRIADAYKRWRP